MKMRRLLVVLAVGCAVRVAGAAEFRPVESRIFDAVKYEERTHTLTLRFDRGAVYAFHDVPRQVYVDFTRIVNHGEYFNRRIRKQYRYERLDRYPGSWCARD